MTDISLLQNKVAALKAQVERDSITPVSLGLILDDFAAYIAEMQTGFDAVSSSVADTLSSFQTTIQAAVNDLSAHKVSSAADISALRSTAAELDSTITEIRTQLVETAAALASKASVSDLTMVEAKADAAIRDAATARENAGTALSFAQTAAQTVAATSEAVNTVNAHTTQIADIKRRLSDLESDSVFEELQSESEWQQRDQAGTLAPGILYYVPET